MYGRTLKQEDLQFLELLEYFSTGIPSLRGVNPPKIIHVRDFWQRASMYPNVYGCNSHSNRVVVMILIVLEQSVPRVDVVSVSASC